MNNIAATSPDENPFRIPEQKIDYAANYKKLSEIVDRLKRGGAGDIDALAETFRAGVAAYEACKSRLDAIKAEIDAEISRLSPPGEA